MKIVLWNCAGTGNLGDDLMHMGTLEYIKGVHSGLIQFAKIFRLNQHTLKTVNEADLLLIGGGQILDLSDFLDKLTTHDVRTVYKFIGVGIGNKEDVAPYLSKLNPTLWGVRDKCSQEILKELGVTESVVLMDDVSQYVRIPQECGFEKRKFGINLKYVNKNMRFAQLMAQELDEIGEPFYAYAFTSIDRQKANIDGEDCEIGDCNDRAFAESIRSHMKRPELCHILTYQSVDTALFASYLRASEFLVCERFHANVLAYRFGIPFVSLCYHRKVKRFLKDRSLDRKLTLAEPKTIAAAIKNHITKGRKNENPA